MCGGGSPHPPALYVALYCIVWWRMPPYTCIVRCTILYCRLEGSPILLHCMLYCMVGGAHIPLRCILRCILLHCMVPGAPILLDCMLQCIAMCGGGGPNPPALYVILNCIVWWMGPTPSCIVCCNVLQCVVEGAPIPLHCMLHYIVLCGGRGSTFLHSIYVALYCIVCPRPPCKYIEE